MVLATISAAIVFQMVRKYLILIILVLSEGIPRIRDWDTYRHPGLQTDFPFYPTRMKAKQRMPCNMTLPESILAMTHQNDIIYMYEPMTPGGISYAEILSDASVEYRQKINVDVQIGTVHFIDIAIYRDTLYFIGGQPTGVHTIDIRPYRPIAKNTKTTIYPVFANEGDTIDLTQYSPDAESESSQMLVSINPII